MREGSTLIHDLLPNSRGLGLEFPKVLPKGSERRTVWEFCTLVVIALSFDLFLDNIGVFAFVMIVALRLFYLSVGLIAMLVVHREVPGFVITWIALALLAYQSALFTKHYVFIKTTMQSPDDCQRLRDGLGASLASSILLMPLTFPWWVMQAIANGKNIWRAWVSFLNYGSDGLDAPGLFHSPAGGYEYRRFLCYTTAGAVTLALGYVPPSVLFLFAGIPAAICITVPSLVLTTKLWRVHRAA